MKNRYLLAALAAIYILGCSIECPAATTPPPSPIGYTKAYSFARVEEVKQNLANKARSCRLTAQLFSGQFPQVEQTFLRMAEAYEESLALLNTLTPQSMPTFSAVVTARRMYIFPNNSVAQ